MFKSKIILLLISLIVQLYSSSLNDVEHVVLFMQENRPFDHYYGTLRGVRGFNDRSMPNLPNGNSVFQQPIQKYKPTNLFCGCGGCDLIWLNGGGELKNIFSQMSCDTFIITMRGANPGVQVFDGQQCSKLLDQMLQSSVQHLVVNQFLSPKSSCRNDLNVNVSKSLFHSQQIAKTYMLPFPLHFQNTSATCMNAPSMGYDVDIDAWNGGLMDGWETRRDPGFGMAYFNRSDLPFYYALADAFTIGDQYFQSTFTATNPNRLHQFSGSNGLSVKNSSFNILDDHEPSSGIKWETVAESLEKNNITWKVFMEEDNFDDNAFAWFDNFKNSKPGEPLYEKGMIRSQNLTEEFKTDIQNNKLPQVSFIVAPAWLSEHAQNHPQDGEELTAKLMQILKDNPSVYNKTAFILNYDEGGQFFDHHWVPTPPANETEGKSTITVEGEITLDEQYGHPEGNPIGLGFRVPIMIISPWTRGGYVYSEVCDHTSTIKFLEKRFNFTCNNISPWRRAITGDLTHAFNFTNPDYSFPDLPTTEGNWNKSAAQCAQLPPPIIPEFQFMPTQENGTRKSRALPYNFEVNVNIVNQMVNLEIKNEGDGGAAFQLWNRLILNMRPKKYAVEGKKSIIDQLFIDSIGNYNYSLHGPNGFVRQIGGNSREANYQTTFNYQNGIVRIEINNADQQFQVINHYNNNQQWQQINQDSNYLDIDISQYGHWYDLEIIGGQFYRRFKGRIETGVESISDPSMAFAQQQKFHPQVPLNKRIQPNWWENINYKCETKRSQFKNICKDACFYNFDLLEQNNCEEKIFLQK